MAPDDISHLHLDKNHLRDAFLGEEKNPRLGTGHRTDT